MKKKAVVDRLLEYTHKKETEMKKKACYVLGELKEEQAIDRLLELALNDKHLGVRRNSVEGLNKIGTQRPIKELQEALEEGDRWTKKYAVEALGEIGDPASIDMLLNSLMDENNGVRWASALALETIGLDENIEDYMIHAIYDEDVRVRYTVVRILGKFRVKKAEQQLINKLHNDERKVRWRAARSLGQIGGKEVIPHLVRALDDDYSEVRWAAIRALGRVDKDLEKDLEDDEIIDKIKSLREEDPSEKVRRAAGELLA